MSTEDRLERLEILMIRLFALEKLLTRKGVITVEEHVAALCDDELGLIIECSYKRMSAL